MAAQTNQMMNSIGQTLRIVLQRCGGAYYIHSIQIHMNDDGPTAMRKIHEAYFELKQKHPYTLWDRYPVLYQPNVEVAHLSANSTSGLEAQQQIHQVFVIDSKEDAELTAAFQNPKLLSDGGCFVTDNAQFFDQPVVMGVGKKVMLIGLKPSMVGILSLILTNVIVCLGPGVLVGLLTRRIDLGVAVTSAVAAIVAVVQALLFIYFR